MAKALATAQVQSVREITKKADIKKTNKKATIFVLALLISLMVLYISYLGYNYYINSRFEYSESEAGITFYSKDFVVKDSLNKILDTSEILIVFNIKEKDLNYTENITESIVLFNSIFASKNVSTVTVIGVLNNRGNLLSCTTNRGDYYTNEAIDDVNCNALMDSYNSKIVVDFPNPSLKSSSVYLYPEESYLNIKSRNIEDLMISNYLILKFRYPDLEKTLQDIEEIKNNLEGVNLINDVNQALIDTNTEIDTNN